MDERRKDEKIAKELVDMFIPFQSDDYPNSDENYNAKKCAFICVDEMLKQPQTSDKQLNFLIEVKQEINKL